MRNNRNIFGLFVFWKVETKQEQLKKESDHRYTNANSGRNLPTQNSRQRNVSCSNRKVQN